ncbi:V-type ATP synthase subunit A [Stackebrandtia nassauensis]|uniref:H(+)-transporting two-sector ATPase n=1 Tax=Stackebrandtia nassauensis (strain DSM 44728 / CIP 108903 / NRRL B-16338 / NBRC 102104 / LLR-40K-21) TaxID=446470 RepID=D3PVL2_STANL|nr:V-type ATP synthase subunit A [Stackebrandtia nassauensis]ADD43126.1 H(+)-transporting two-sector ATPase [Stackebrandtia nassauensis DSM 44728]
MNQTFGRVRRVCGPLVDVDLSAPVAMNETVWLGTEGIPGEVVAVRDDIATVQAYEDTGCLAPKAVVRTGGSPLSAPLGPGLLGGVFDGLLRPLSDAPDFLGRGTAAPSFGSRPWSFDPLATVGARVGPGDELGVLRDSRPVKHPVLVPPTLAGELEYLAPEGRYPAETVIARVAGQPVHMAQPWPVRRPRPVRNRLEQTAPLHTGQRVLDLLFPVPRGGSAAVPGGFGTGKTVLLQQVAKWCDADVIVYIGCGERGNEMAEVVAELLSLTDPRSGGRLADRTVVIANTSNMPMMAREASIHTGMTVAEYFRDMGLHVVLIADSTSRWAEALREFASRNRELPAEEGYPAGLASALAAFYERAGVVETLGGRIGSVTVVGAVSPPGGDLTEPVTAYTERFVRCRWTLDRDLAYARHYPSVSWSGSFCRDAETIGAWHAAHGDRAWWARRERLTTVLSEADRLSALAELVGTTALPPHERVILLGGRLIREAVLQQSALSATDAHCTTAKTVALAEAVIAVIDAAQTAVTTGVPAADVEGADYSPLVRAREESGPDDVEGVRARRDVVLERLKELAS